MAERSDRPTTRVVMVDVAPRSVMRVALAMGVALAVSILVATACLIAMAKVTGVHRPIDRLFTTVQHSGRLDTSEILLAVGIGLAVVVVVGAAFVGAMVALFANHVLPLAGGMAVDEEDPTA